MKPMLRTWDLDRTLAFYIKSLECRCEALNREWGWAHPVRDSAVVMFSGPNDHEGDRFPQGTGSLYFTVSEVDGLWGAVRQQARVCYPPEDFPYGMREFAIYDNNGYLLQFGQPTD